ncbi:MAG: hypothetical protein GXY32_07655 [Ruminococcaceae bacterium]|nr:hypothetical protein [Oscillospiraceae bacterium]
MAAKLTAKKWVAALMAGVLALALVFCFVGLPVSAAVSLPETAVKGITYSANKKTVTLKNHTGSESLYFDGDITIKLVGNNTIYSSSVSGPIINGQGTLTFTGSGSLTIYSISQYKTARGYAIQAKDGVVFKSGTVNLYGTKSGMRFGVQAPGITIHDTARLSIQAFGTRDSYVAPYALFSIGKVTFVGSPALYEGKTAASAVRVSNFSYELCTDSHIGGQYGTKPYISVGAPNPLAQPKTAIKLNMKSKVMAEPHWAENPDSRSGYDWVQDTVQLAAASTTGKAWQGLLFWASSNEAVASVNPTGLVNARGAGTATITAKTLAGKKAQCTITVANSAITVERVAVNAKAITLARKGKTAQIECTVYPENASNQAVEFTSSNEKVAKVSKTGKVTAVKKGTATVTVRTKEGGKKATVKVTVKK